MNLLPTPPHSGNPAPPSLMSEPKAENAPPTLVPTLTPPELDALHRYARTARGIFEYGCGHSTSEFVRLDAARVVSIDSDPAWIKRLRLVPELAKAEDDGRLTLIHADIGPVTSWGKPRNGNFKKRWSSYTLAPWLRDPEFTPDVVFVDGRFRVSCILATFLFGPPGVTVMAHDFWTRDQYHRVLDFATVVERVERLAVLRPAPDVDWKALADALRLALNQPN